MKRSSPLKLVGLSAVLIAVVLFAFFWSWVPISNRLQWTCAKTGSQKGKQVYFGFIHTGDYYRSSGLERLFVEKGHEEIQHEWVKTVGTERYVLVMTRSHSRAPASYHFNSIFQQFMEQASADQKTRMMKVFLNGPEADRKAFLREAEQIAFGITEP
jgi:hypothetical protein